MIHTSSKATTLHLNISTTSRTILAADTLRIHLRKHTRDTKIPISSNSAMVNSQDTANTSSKAMGTSHRDTGRRSTASLERLADLQKAIVA
jgi:hypothetical protein